GKCARDLLLQVRQFKAFMGSCPPTDAWNYRSQMQFQFDRVFDLASAGHAKQALGAIITLVDPTMFFASASSSQIIHAFSVNREETHSRSVFRGHVGDGCTVHDGQRRRTRTKELD